MTKMQRPREVGLSDHLGMRVGVRYVVTRDSKNREFQSGDIVWMEADGSIMCVDAHGWMPPEDVITATDEWAIAPDARWAAKTRAELERRLDELNNSQALRNKIRAQKTRKL